MAYGFGGDEPVRETQRRTYRAPVRRERIEPDVQLDGATNECLYFSVGGGLSPSRIVKKLEKTDVLIRENLNYLVEYAKNNTANAEERMILETINDRQSKSDYMVIVNQGEAAPNRYLQDSRIENMTVERNRGTVSFPYVDIAIVSAEEGGLEKLCR